MLSELSPLHKIHLRFLLSQFPFSALSWVNKFLGVYIFENNEVTALL